MIELKSIRVRYRHWYFRMPWMKPYVGMVWGRTIILRQEPEQVPDELLGHELVHIDQINRYGVLGFYLRYLGIYFKGLLKLRSHRRAYWEHPYEVEARKLAREKALLYKEALHGNSKLNPKPQK